MAKFIKTTLNNMRVILMLRYLYYKTYEEYTTF